MHCNNADMSLPYCASARRF